jgi:hypothetical protein
MKTRIATLCATTVVALSATPLLAQDQASEQAVRDFFDGMRQTVTEAVEASDTEGLMAFTRDTLADDASFTATTEMVMGGERKSIATVMLDKEDMLRLGRMASGMMGGMHGDALQDYELDVTVNAVTPIGPDAARVSVDYAETATLAMPAQAGGSGTTDDVATGATTGDAGEDPEAAADAANTAASAPAGGAAGDGAEQTISVTSTASCEHLLHRGEGDAWQIGLTTCEARTEI